ncbi:transposase [Saccharicrinis sp. 156]|uniref:transposase n=1 Tax=Saccharicrinis sp. 156 TaxID=3417574 RepID=UPI003D33CD90
MTDKFQNKYRIPSSRLQNWDYGWNAHYFVTICTHNRECYFGDISDGKMQFSEIGKIVKIEWLKTFEMRADMNLQMGAYVVMPNHFHAIITIGENEYNTERGTERRDAMHCVSTTATNNMGAKNQFGPQSKNLASIIRGFKIGVTKNARKIHADFAWQSRFHDHIIRNDKSFEKIQSYIIENPLKWNNDKFNVKTD